MLDDHPNISVLKRVNPTNLAASVDAFSEGVVFHYFNPALPDMQADYVDRDDLPTFFEKLTEVRGPAFKVNPATAKAMGDELVVSHVKNTLPVQERSAEVDAVVIWRIVDGQITEAWDIPATNTARPLGL